MNKMATKACGIADSSTQPDCTGPTCAVLRDQRQASGRPTDNTLLAGDGIHRAGVASVMPCLERSVRKRTVWLFRGAKDAASWTLPLIYTNHSHFHHFSDVEPLDGVNSLVYEITQLSCGLLKRLCSVDRFYQVFFMRFVWRPRCCPSFVEAS